MLLRELQFSPAADRLVYGCQTTTGGALYIGPGDGVGEPRMLLKSSATEFYAANAFLAGESGLILTHPSGGKPELMLLPLEVPKQGEATPIKLIADASGASLSPDHHWIAYQSDSSGRVEVYARRIEAGGSLGPLIPVTRSGGAGPRWYRGEGAAPLEIHYGTQSKVWSVTLTTEPRVSISEPRPVSGDLTDLNQKSRGGAGALPDGRSIAILAGDDEEPPTEASIVLHWSTELKQRLAETH